MPQRVLFLAGYGSAEPLIDGSTFSAAAPAPATVGAAGTIDGTARIVVTPHAAIAIRNTPRRDTARAFGVTTPASGAV